MDSAALLVQLTSMLRSISKILNDVSLGQYYQCHDGVIEGPIITCPEGLFYFDPCTEDTSERAQCGFGTF